MNGKTIRYHKDITRGGRSDVAGSVNNEGRYVKRARKSMKEKV